MAGNPQGLMNILYVTERPPEEKLLGFSSGGLNHFAVILLAHLPDDAD